MEGHDRSAVGSPMPLVHHRVLCHGFRSLLSKGQTVLIAHRWGKASRVIHRPKMFSPFANYRPSSWDPEDELAEVRRRAHSTRHNGRRRPCVFWRPRASLAPPGLSPRSDHDPPAAGDSCWRGAGREPAVQACTAGGSGRHRRRARRRRAAAIAALPRHAGCRPGRGHPQSGAAWPSAGRPQHRPLVSAAPSCCFPWAHPACGPWCAATPAQHTPYAHRLLPAPLPTHPAAPWPALATGWSFHSWTPAEHVAWGAAPSPSRSTRHRAPAAAKRARRVRWLLTWRRRCCARSGRRWR